MPPQLEVAPHVAGNSRQQPCPDCGHNGSVESYPHDRIPHTYCFACSRWTPLDLQLPHDPATAAQRAQDVEDEKRQQQHEAALFAQRMWNQATPADENHPYLVLKQVAAGDIRQLHSQLLIPLFDLESHLWNLQLIDEHGNKRFLKNSRKKGCYFVLGSWESSTLLFCEGWATGATLHQATQHSVVVCFDAGNLLEVVQQVAKRFPDSQKVICADNDQFEMDGQLRSPEKNVGVVKATRAAQAVNGVLVVPEFPPTTHAQRPTDWNDMSNVINLAEVRRQIAAAMNPPESTAATTLALNNFRGSDDANANLLLELHGSDIKFCSTWNKWLIWSNAFWKIDDELDVFRLAADVPKSLYQQAATCNDKQQRRAFAELAFRLESVSKRNAMLIAAKHRVAVHHNKLDTHAFLLNVANGQLDLRTGQLQNHHRGHLLTHFSNLAYDAIATAPTWQQFLEDVFSGDQELIHFIAKAVGYSLTGDVREQCLFICHGVGSNGKSVFLNILRKLLGTLALQSAPDLLMADKQRRHPTEQADLFGKRLVICTETEEGHRFKEVLVKQLTGGDSCRARRMHEDFWEFAPTWKIFIATNHKPTIRGTDHAIWRRIRLIPFNVKFHDPGEGVPVKDLAMEGKLTAELPGILTWAVQGCLAWQQEGLQAPTAVKSATEGYRQEMDVLAAFLSECCVTQPHCQVRASDLYAAYLKWCEQSGEYAEKQRKFGMRLTERGFQRFAGAKGYSFWRGIGLKDEAD